MSRISKYIAGGACLGLQGPLEVGIKVAYGILKCIRTMCCRSWGLQTKRSPYFENLAVCSRYYSRWVLFGPPGASRAKSK